jgi:N utilization substance protein A
VRGVRIQAIVRELSDEKIDVIEWSNDAAAFIAKALSPARVLGVYLAENSEEGKTATVVVPEDQLSLAIGRDGQNARLAAKLTGWRIDIKSQVEAATDAMQKLQEDPAYAEMAEREVEAQEKVAIMLEKKAEGRPLPPEDYDYMAKFINRVEKRVEEKLREENLEEKRRYEAALATVPELTFEIDILDVDLKEHILFILQEAGMDTLGDLVLQMRIDPDRILGLNGIGPKTFTDIQELTDGLRVIPEEPQPEPEAIVEEPSEEEVVVEAEVVEEVPVLAEPEVEEEPVVAETPEVVEPVKPVVPEKPEPVEEEAEEEDDFDKLFSYDASKYGYYEPEKVLFDEEEVEDVKPTKKKKRKKPRPPVDEPDHWDEW